MKFDSLILRAAIWTAALITIALIAAWFVLRTLLGGFVENRVTLELDAVALSVLSTATWQAPTSLIVTPPPSDPRFTPPYSGWYWQVDDGVRVLARSRSLASSDLGIGAAVEFDRDGRALLVHRRVGTAPGASARITVAVAVPRATVDAEVDLLTGPLLTWTWVLGITLLLASLMGSLLGQRALVALRAQLAALQRGDIEALSDPGVRELRSLTRDFNQLIEDRRVIVERSRAHVGNLAHALKTPLAALRNRSGDVEVLALLGRLERSVRWHLGRARVVGLRGGVGFRASVEVALADVGLVLRHEAVRRGVVLDVVGGDGCVFLGELEDLTEILGNVVENAVRHAVTRVVVRVRKHARGSFVVTIRDDGLGIHPSVREVVLRRGVSLSDVSEGSGLGLAIVMDLVALYGGSIAFEDAFPEGPRPGLEVRIVLPGT